MKKSLLYISLASLLATVPPAMAETKTNDGKAYLLSQTKDISTDFLDFSNTYFFADSLVSFDTATGTGTIEWKRQQLQPRQAFNANTFLHQPLKSLDFPDTAYPQDPELGFSVTPVGSNALRIKVYTSPVTPEQDDALSPMLAPGSTTVYKGNDWTVTRDGQNIVYSSPSGSLEIQAYPWRLVLKDADGMIMTETKVWSDNDSSQVKTPPFSFIKRGSDNSRSINPVWTIAPTERIYGFGESATPLNKVGQKLNLFVTDPQGPETPDMYKPIPFFMSNKGYGMFLHTAAPFTADVGQSYIGANKLYMMDEMMDLFVFFGEPKDVLSAYTAISGRPEMPPTWSFGTWISRITYFTEDEGREVAENLKKYQIPADVIHFDTGWFDVDWQCDYEFSPSRFQNPGKMISDLKDDGYHICLWQLPYFVPGNKYYPELVQKGLAVKNGCGTLPYEDAVLDFTNPETVAWYQDKLAGLLNLGVSAIKVDFGEGAPIEGIYHNGRNGWYEHNLYPVRYNKAVADITKKLHNENIIWARSAWAGSQRYPLHWGGDAATTNTGMSGTLREGISLGLSGFCFWSHDMGGFVTSTPEELYRRWLPMGFLTSHTRAHGAPPTEPWLYENPEFTDYFRQCAEMKYSLMPYILEESETAVANGWPMMRALFVEYPDDPGAWMVDDQYLFGSKILVAPFLENTETRAVYLPGNKPWVDYQSGKKYNPGWHTMKADGPIRCIIMVPQGSEIPTVKPALTTKDLDLTKVTKKKF
ncbi:MAG: alpha-xylosidase [Bacteroidales bacterium]|nr:alpha-xylosidase [Bacteroidales bacterium]